MEKTMSMDNSMKKVQRERKYRREMLLDGDNVCILELYIERATGRYTAVYKIIRHL